MNTSNSVAPVAPLAAGVRTLIAYIAAPLGTIAALIDAQAAAASVVVDSATMLDVEVPPNMKAVPLPDGPIPVRAIVHNQAEDPEGEILVWLRGGLLVGVEQAWFTEEAPTQWPTPDMVHLS